ncbi:FAD:protein FMN transferase [candidate division KSB1 bacterium]
MTEDSKKQPFIDHTDELPENACRFSFNAMATVFEIIMIHDDRKYAEQCAHQAFTELDRLEQELSRFIENSDISRINNSKAGQSIIIGPDTFRCLLMCKDIYNITNKAFDITYRSMPERGTEIAAGKIPGNKLSVSNDKTGMHLLELGNDSFTVKLNADNINLDLGGFGKGYAVDFILDILLEWEINCALINGGSSSVFAVGTPPDEKGWQVRLRDPDNFEHIISDLYLKNCGVSGSGIRKGQHIIDPRTGLPVSGKSAAWAVCKTAAVSDALSTAFMIMSPEEINELCKNNEDIQAVIITKGNEDKVEILRFGEVKDNIPNINPLK